MRTKELNEKLDKAAQTERVRARCRKVMDLRWLVIQLAATAAGHPNPMFVSVARRRRDEALTIVDEIHAEAANHAND